MGNIKSAKKNQKKFSKLKLSPDFFKKSGAKTPFAHRASTFFDCNGGISQPIPEQNHHDESNLI